LAKISPAELVNPGDSAGRWRDMLMELKQIPVLSADWFPEILGSRLPQ
jgi:hypothetical protein